ncbi:pilus assembly protein N-terminal domain-containing protein [Methyloligella solikamskensis]|uniref:Pilus assembly protein N-terminal domain-containing protein n=1 Tax=Methyloligella solikamskensis TaxID=1177756 RepID=A0ABW3JCW6_9HYPH
MRDVTGFRASLWALALTLPLAFTGGAIPQAFAEGVIEVPLDKAKLVHLEEPAAEIIVGNPSIADIAVQNSKLLVVTGKSFGRTNLIVVNAKGDIIEESDLTVSDPSNGMITVHRGARNNETVYCAPKCTSPLAIGDNSEYFDTIQKQLSAKQGMGQGSAASGVQ